MVRLTVVNDNRDLLDLIGEILEGDRYVTTLIETVDGDAAEAICRSKPDLLLIGLRHADRDRCGWQTAQEIRRASGCENLPVILCSTDPAALNEVKAELDTAPGVAALTLPFTIDELLQSIRRLLDKREAFRCN